MAEQGACLARLLMRADGMKPTQALLAAVALKASNVQHKKPCAIL
jgi:hypothetical protein